ncbi:MAG: TonB-dependent receptor, partial [Pseudomonadota bacterium]
YNFTPVGQNLNCNPVGTFTTAQLIQQNANNQAATLENFLRGRPSAYTVQVPVVGGKLSDAISQFTIKDTGLFVQDTWNATSRLTLTYGLRMDSSSVDNKPKANAPAALPMVAGTVGATAATNVRQSGGFGLDNTVTIDGQKLYQPRFGFNYKLSDTKAMQVRGGFGLFQGAAASVWLSNPFSNPGTATRVVTCSTTSTPNCGNNGGLFNPNPDAQSIAVAGATPASNIDFLDPKLKQPSIWKMNLAFDTELPWMGLVFGAEYLELKNKDSIYYKNLNLGGPVKTGPDGRPMFYSQQGYLPASWNSTGGVVSGSGVTSKALSNLSYANVLEAVHTDKGTGKVFTVQLSRPVTKGLGMSIAYTRTDAKEVSPLSSSVSNSNFNGRASFNPNEEVAANSGYMVKDRVNASVSWAKKFFGNYNTRFGMFYEGRSGKPYSWTVNNDLNGDGLAGNDLMYIPSAPGSGEVSFFGADAAAKAAAEAKFWNVVQGNKSLMRSRGGVTQRNDDFGPWTNSFDMRLSQEIRGIFKGNKGFFSLDFFNFGNMLNKKWGRINEVAFQSAGGQARSFVDYGGLDANGKYVYIVRSNVETIDIRQAKGESQWAIQATVKYEF